MTEHGNDNEPDLWANTGNQPFVPPVPPVANDPATDPTIAQPPIPGQPEPTAIQPVTPGPLNSPAAAASAGVVAGSGMPPARPPVPPTGGGPGGPAGPGGPTGPGSEQPAWLVPGAIGLGVAVLAALVIFFVTRGGDEDALSTDVSSTTSIVPETTLPSATTIVATTIATDTTIAAETTLAPETTIAPETTVAPTTAAPTTAPTTAAPTTAAPEGITPAAPGQILIANSAFDIVSACTSNPVPGYGVVSYVAFGDLGPLVVEEGNDEGNVFGMFSDRGIAIETGDYEDLGDAGFGMLASEGDGAFEVAANPGDITVGLCDTRGTVRLSDPAAPEFGYNYGIVDMCASTSPFRAIGYLSEGGTLRIVDNGDDTAQITFDTIDLFSATDPVATITDVGGRQQIEGQITGSTIEGDTTQAILIDFDPATARGCFGSETP
jgi:hypothetical protein